MAEDVLWKERYTKLREKCSKLEEGRNALRNGISIFEQQLSKLQDENAGLKKAFEDEQARAENEKSEKERESEMRVSLENEVGVLKSEKERESGMRVSLENEVGILKSEIQALRETGNLDAPNLNEEVIRLEQHISEGDIKIHQLNELLGKERVRADAEKKRADSEKKRADSEKKRADSEKKRADSEKKTVDEALKRVKGEIDRAQEDKRLADVERKKAEDYKVQLDALKMEIDQVKLKLASEKSNFEETKKKLKEERGQLSNEKKHAVSTLAKVEEQRKLAEANRRMAMEEKNRADILFKRLEEERRKVVQLKKDISELNSRKNLGDVFGDLPDKGILSGNVKRKAMLSSDPLKSIEAQGKLMEARDEIIRENKSADSEMKKAKEQKKATKSSKKKTEGEKHCVHKLYGEVEENKRKIEEMQSLVEKLVSSKTSVKSPLPVIDKSSYSESAKVKLLRKQVKFEKTQVKHAKQVAELEVARNQLLRQELCRLKQKFVKLSQDLDILDNSVFSSGKDIHDLEKLGGLNLKRKHSHVEPHQMHIVTVKDALRPTSTCSTAADGSPPLTLSANCSGPLLPVLGHSHTESVSGIDSISEPPHRGSNQKKLQSSAVNSCSASFSDRQLGGSHEGGTLSVITSAKFAAENSKLEQSVSRLYDGTRKRCRGNLAAITDNSIKSHSHVVATQKKTGCDNRNRKLLHTVESIENLYSKGSKRHQPVAKRLSVLHGISNTQIDQPSPEKGHLIPDPRGNLCNDDVICFKRRKISSEEEMMVHLCDSSEPRSGVKTISIEEPDICKRASSSSYNPTGSIQAQKDEIDDYFCSQHLLGSFHELGELDYMKLLDFDIDDDEKSYRAALEMPLSPTLPELKFDKGDTFEVDDSEHVVIDIFHKGFSNVKENVATIGSFDAMEVETDSMNKLMILNSVETSAVLRLQEQKDVNNSTKNSVDNEDGECDIAQLGNTRFCESHSLGAELRTPDATIFEVSSTSYENVFASSDSSLPRYCIVSSDIQDRSSISRIFGSISNCKSQCSIISSSNFVRDILVALVKAEEISSQEKVCTFISLLLQNISKTVTKNLGDVMDRDFLQLVDVLHCNMSAVFSSVDTKIDLVKLWDFHDVLNLVEDFLLSKRVLVDGNVSSESIDDLILNDIDTMDTLLSLEAAPSCLLVAGGVLLASMCASTDHIGFICEASCNIFRSQKLDSSVKLTILHVFAYVCGAKYFVQEGYGLAVTVVRSLVVNLERLKFSNDMVETPCKLLSYSNCPFLKDAASTSGVVSLLLEELHNYIIADVERQNPAEQMYLPKAGAKCRERDYWKAVPSDLSHLFDILSLLELMACFMSWDWSFDNIICPTLKMLESSDADHFSAAVITLLGQLGRYGIDASGYESTKIDNLRDRLSSFLSLSTTREWSILVQLASVTALIGLTPSCEELVNSQDKILVTVDCIKKWFSSLSEGQQFAFRIELSSTIPENKMSTLLPEVSSKFKFEET